ncbi:MAG: hypothetical protein K8E66_10125, partial [Phycisphaerales bacterium]|nr:hypothetical protein [Phycisphaerales bacterium]
MTTRVPRNTAPRRLIAGLALMAAGSTFASGPVGVDVLKLRPVLHDDVRVLWLGDSYCIPYENRPPGGSLLSWRFDAWTAFTMGDGPNWFFVKYDELYPTIGTIDAVNGYRLYQTGPDDVVRYALPVWRLRELYADAPSPSPFDAVRY